jgi:hypothetical protein
MAYSRRGTVDVTRFSNDVLDNVMVRDGFRHDVRFTDECMRLEPLYSGGGLNKYILATLVSSWVLRNQSFAHHVPYRTPDFDMIHTRNRHERHNSRHNNCIIDPNNVIV